MVFQEISLSGVEERTPPTCRHCGRAMALLDEAAQRWYCYTDDELFLRKEQQWSDEVRSPPSQITQYAQVCHCGRSSSHVHYSKTHDNLAKLGIVSFVFVEILAFLGGAVKGGTLLYDLSYDEVQAYTLVSNRIAEALGPYQYLLNLATAYDFIAIGSVITAALTMRSRKTTLHRAALLVAVITILIEVTAALYYAALVPQITSQVASQIGAGIVNGVNGASIVNTAASVQGKLHDAYGFWDSSLYYAGSNLLTFVSLALFGGAALTSKTRETWETESFPTIPPQAVAPLETPISKTPQEQTSVKPIAKSTKFCRYCGAKILRESKFCEECGMKLA